MAVKIVIVVAEWQGLAKALLHGVLAGMDGSVSLNVATRNLAARALYAGLGFVVEREFDGDFVGQACPAMRLTLDVGNLRAFHAG